LITLSVVFAYVTFPKENGPKSGSRVSRWGKSFGVWRSLILVLAAVPIAILTNALRVSGTGVLAHYYGTGVADGFFHSFSGWVIYISAALLLFAAAWLIDRFEPASLKVSNENPGAEKNIEGTMAEGPRAPTAVTIRTGEAK
jgi:exosortase/archaeosortase family protein